MIKRQLPKGILDIHPIGLGANSIGGHNIYQNLDEQVNKAIIKSFLDQGGNLIDTAFYYGLGRSEELIGELLQDINQRSKAIIATKAAHRKVNEEMVFDNSPSFLKQSVELALKRCQTDVLDIFYIHFPDLATSKAQAIETLAQLKKEGKIKAIGVSNFTLDQLKEANQHGLVDVVQDRYNLFYRELEGEYTDYLMANKIGFIPYFPLASGLLTGKYQKDTPLTLRQQRNPLFASDNYFQNLDKIDVLKSIAQEKEVEVSQIVLAWYLTLPFVTAVIPGAKSVDQVTKNLVAAEIELTTSEIDLIQKTFHKAQ